MEALKGKVIPVIRTSKPEAAEAIVETLLGLGMAAFELNLTIPDCLALVERLVARHPRLVLGVGTVLDAVDAAQVIDAGARFVVSPAVLPEVAEACWKLSTPFFLGAATPTEILAAHRLGAAGVKLFPATQLGGVGFLRALKAVYPEIPIMPTGGITPAEAKDYFAAGAFAVGIGGGFSREPVDLPALHRAVEMVKEAG
ncbi:MAG: bifunctional 4-hydroxy-2-oxoglutarate aldolase/2-dehydro-3-deoxy-phosphogluconate aldolase [Alphaproteobacteria bacterium]|nr:bifunctional 4-hydroxy-2-oxoglutarate aldolase/2-dehydro-3-deoxy-phosphogluconate aldolase [Alphaproteobacteria bacterium]